MLFRNKYLFLLSLIILIAGFLIYWANTYVSPSITFNPSDIGEDPEAYIARVESRFKDIKPGLEKQIIWQNPDTKAKTDYAVVYIHGFSASKDEIRPVPDLVASSIQANLYYTRLPGHARTPAAMGEPGVDDYFNALAEALAIAKAIGNKVIIISTSFGGTLSAWTDLTDHALKEDIEAIVLVSPVFELAAAGTSLLTYPLAEFYTPIIVASTVSRTPMPTLKKSTRGPTPTRQPPCFHWLKQSNWLAVWMPQTQPFPPCSSTTFAMKPHMRKPQPDSSTIGAPQSIAFSSQNLRATIMSSQATSPILKTTCWFPTVSSNGWALWACPQSTRSNTFKVL